MNITTDRSNPANYDFKPVNPEKKFSDIAKAVATIAIPVLLAVCFTVPFIISRIMAYNGTNTFKLARLSINTALSSVCGERDKPFNTSKINHHDPQALADKLCSKYDKKEILTAINTLTTSNDPRFNGKKEGCAQFTFDKDEFIEKINRSTKTPQSSRAEIRQEEPETEDIDDIEAPTTAEKMTKKIANELAILVKREDVVVPFESSKGKCTITQSMGHVSAGANGITYTKGKTASAESQKIEKLVELANQGSISMKGVDNKEKFITGRSARTSSEEQMKNSSLGIIADKFAAEGEEGFVLSEDKVLEFQKVDISFLDTARRKQVATRLLSGSAALLKGRPIEDEYFFDKKHRQVIEKIWDPNGAGVKIDPIKGPYIEHEICVNVKQANGSFTEELKKFREYKPVYMNVLVSAIANEKSDLQVAHEKSLPSAILMGKQLSHHIGAAELREAVNRCEQKRSKENLNSLKAEIQRAKEKNPKADPIALDGIYALIAGETMNGESMLNVEGTKKTLLYTLAIAETLKMGPSIKCKSGNDRTAIGISTAVAREAFATCEGHPYDPGKTDNTPEDDALFAKYFTQAMETFGFATILASRGPIDSKNSKPELKTGRSPLFLSEMKKVAEPEKDLPYQIK